MNSERTKKIASRALLILSVLALIVMIGTVLVTSLYTVPISDDYWYARTGIGAKGLWHRLIVAVQFSYEIYVHHQGTYFTSFIGSLFNPLIHGGFPKLRVVMFINAVMAFASILSFVYVALGKLKVNSATARVFILAVATFVITGFDAFQEIFYWFVGACVYGFPMSLGMFAVTLLLLANDRETARKSEFGAAAPEGRVSAVPSDRMTSKAKLLYIASAILGFCAVGASLAITGTVCWLVLSIVVFYAVKDKKLDRKNISVFLACFGGALINAAAPGNFIRLDLESGESFTLIDGISNTWGYFIYALRWLFINKNYGCVFLALIITGFAIFRRSRTTATAKDKQPHDDAGAPEESKCFTRAYAILSAMLLFTPFVTVFPVLMGYGVGWMPNRCFYILIVVMDIALGNLALAVGALLSDLLKEKAQKPVLIALAAVLLALFVTTPYNIREYIFLKMDKQLYLGEFQENYDKTKAMIDSFADMEGEDVELDVPTHPEEIRNFYCFYLTEDPTSNFNKDIAKAYGLKSIVNTRKED
ncbi:DUF6056 family protein [Butyrivibrio sp. INlla21]|uniref:DUF6056 family protein n=1 Tax=Butyrivibrio sp. INlla21 TaxID=1520811 RepID=UPI0008EA9656|nr:DUF6056 family protein [Butyrivibrio sp. INlla21]SFU87378.1 hypothetical protein SAMN02910342_02147 [Butyrivibrio sp. INlla21]